jgi:NAD(P)-dependent dehydrogenase (short-subunit alcohol dehydrogenase family)
MQFIHDLPPLVLNVLMGAGALVWFVFLLWLLGRILSFIRSKGRLDLSNRVVVVTGCDSGFGQALVHSLVAANAKVVAMCLTEEGAKAVLEAGAVEAPCLDITDEAALAEAMAKIESHCEAGLWGLVHCAGVAMPGFIDYLPLSFYKRSMEVNFHAAVSLTHKAISLLKKASGRVVFLSSVDGLVSLPGNAPYDASKFAVEAYADALRAEMSFWKISVSVVNPATMKTPMAMRFFEAHRDAWRAKDAEDPQGEWKEAWSQQWLDEYVAFNSKQLERIAQDPKRAVDDIFHALAAKRPKTRYLSGTLAKTLFYLLWIGPESLGHAFKKGSIQPPPRTKN